MSAELNYKSEFTGTSAEAFNPGTVLTDLLALAPEAEKLYSDAMAFVESAQAKTIADDGIALINSLAGMVGSTFKIKTL